jgi:outer membrane protein
MRLAAVSVPCLIFLAASAVYGADGPMTLRDIAVYASQNNPKLKSATIDVASEGESVEIAEGERRPRLDAQVAATRSRYDSALTPISGKPGPGSSFPDFSNPVYDAGLSFSLPIYRGGRLTRNVTVARLRQASAGDALSTSREDLLFNLASLYFKILQMEKMKASAEAAVSQMEAHHKDVTSFYESGSLARLDVLKSEVELARARHNVQMVENSLESAFAALKALMGMEDASARIELAQYQGQIFPFPPEGESITAALTKRSELSAARTRIKIHEERILIADGKRLPNITLTGDYGGRSADDMRLNENWNASLRMSVPILDGGTIAHEAAKETREMEKAREEERALRINIAREVKDARLSVDMAGKRIETLAPAVTAAREALRVERLRFGSGAGSSTDVTDAAVSALRIENDQSQAVYDRDSSLVSLARAMGELSHSLEISK